MTIQTFLKQLTSISVGLWLLFYAVMTGFEIDEGVNFYSTGIICFLLFNVILFIYGLKHSQSENLFSFNQTVIVSMLFKFLMVMIILLVFKKLNGKVSSPQAIIFIIIYLVYTIYEVYYLTDLAKLKSREKR